MSRPAKASQNSTPPPIPAYIRPHSALIFRPNTLSHPQTQAVVNYLDTSEQLYSEYSVQLSKLLPSATVHQQKHGSFPARGPGMGPPGQCYSPAHRSEPETDQSLYALCGGKKAPFCGLLALEIDKNLFILQATEAPPQSLPNDVFCRILEHFTDVNGVKEAWKLRIVSREWIYNRPS